MPATPLTARQERYCHAVAKGSSQRQAYLEAGYAARGKTADEAASRLAKNIKVKQRITELQVTTAKRAEITRDTIVAQLEQARQVALAADPPQISAAVAAAMGMAKLLGLVLNRSELTVIRDKPSPVPTRILELSEEDWKKTFANKTVTSHNDR